MFTWNATSLSSSKVCFEPRNALRSFCWERVAPDTVTVTQRWTSSEGNEQSFVLTLSRVLHYVWVLAATQTRQCIFCVSSYKDD